MSSVIGDFVLWFRAEILQLGLLPQPPSSKLSFESLLGLVQKYRQIHEINAKYYSIINAIHDEKESGLVTDNFITIAEWETVGSEDLCLTEAQIIYFFDKFTVLREIRSGQRKRSANGADEGIPFYEFVIYLYLQTITKVGFASNFARGTQWMDGAKSPASVIKHAPGQLYVTLEEQLQFIRDHLENILRLISSSGQSQTIKLEELEALNFLLVAGPNLHTRWDSSITRLLPASSLKDQRVNLSALTAWILDRLCTNTYLYTPYELQTPHADDPPLTPSIANIPLELPMTIAGVTKQTIFKTDRQSIPGNVSLPSPPEGPAMLLSASSASVASHNGRISHENSLSEINGPNLGLSPSDTSLSASTAIAAPNDKLNRRNSVGSDSSISSSIASSAINSSAMTTPATLHFARSAQHSYEFQFDHSDARISNCTNCYIYLLLPLGHMRIENCTDCIVVLGAVSGVLDIRHCRNVQFVVACHAIQVSNSQNCLFNLLTNQAPMLLGNNVGLHFAPYNTHYRSLTRHLKEARINPGRNFWDTPVVASLDALLHTRRAQTRPNQPDSSGPTSSQSLAFGGLHSTVNATKAARKKSSKSTKERISSDKSQTSISSKGSGSSSASVAPMIKTTMVAVPVGSANASPKPAHSPRRIGLSFSPSRSHGGLTPEKLGHDTYELVRPHQFVPFRIPFELAGDTKANPYELPLAFKSALEEQAEEALELKKTIEGKKLDKRKREKLKQVIRVHFEEWLRQTGNIQQIEDLASA